MYQLKYDLETGEIKEEAIDYEKDSDQIDTEGSNFPSNKL